MTRNMSGKQREPRFFFIHGAGGTARKWRRTTARLQGIPWQTVDLPGHGEARDAAAPDQVSIEWYAEALASRIEEAVILVGHSMGGLISLELAARTPNVVGVILAASHVRLPVHPKILDQLAQGTFPESLFLASYSKTVDPELLAEERQELAINPPEMTLADFRSCDRYSQGAERLRQLNIPVLAVYGAEDRLLPPGAEAELRSIRPDVQTAAIDGAGHYVMLEQPQAFVEAMLQFRESLFKA
ncbi:MAG: hypothetical protein BAA01_06030 [Bacillus thermozeamaize]|uniref:AB hydrolase-1 domain-containing protein n=1 Tax=Bacillus thermozeamaize TaxID=230954 RepID=A0A1Y3PBI4_9BACI|nr:MAG: hypothetical protein BAA01_06030 [Bacillus thermozeamaize]